MSEYAFSRRLDCIVSIDFALSPLGKSKLGYGDHPKESQNFHCPFPNCYAQMSIRGWRVIQNEQRLPKNRSFARMGKEGHIKACTVQNGTYDLPDEEVNKYTANEPAIVKTKYILHGSPSEKKPKKDITPRKNVGHSGLKNHNIHGLLAIVQRIMDPSTNLNESSNITWRKPKDRQINGLESERTFNDLVINLFQSQEIDLEVATINIFFGYAKFDLNDNFVRAKIYTSIENSEGNPFVMAKICSIEELNNQALTNENAAELLKFINSQSDKYRVCAIAGYLMKPAHQQSSSNKVFYNLILYSDTLSDAFVFLGDTQYTLAKPYFERNKNSV
ncbi:unnamed protein product [Fructobacillus evanidus]|uniref:hypothetical protein n=1 Tax=Fructobacillus evanidus TaxID=3064281 RepID=UPI002D93EDCA|nr:unnamed protein product [Fructobacillus sp. LMG 32999]CAK1229994.1 unnamed protein product [Fructobacillus sp. LMG 32999]CAK1230659.1 unnamed protein product [Fructobacillus sp. LMG 32999]CAK1231851.1 unnamed protein product [Fructobacillus sp. LMG 32999]CAK1240433.1 unnamed protein product [Fructobacillus sp. LMG 32999]